MPQNVMPQKMPVNNEVAIPWLEAIGARKYRNNFPASKVGAAPTLRLLHTHLAHAGLATGFGRREAAAFALALTQPEAAAAVRGFLAGKSK